jgi:hypothetical protein
MNPGSAGRELGVAAANAVSSLDLVNYTLYFN